MKPRTDFNPTHNWTDKNSILRHLSPEETEYLKEEMNCNHYQKGEMLYKEGSRLSGVYYINSGVVKIFKTGMEGRDQILRFPKAGELIGYRSVLSEETACTSAKIHEESLLCFIPTHVLNHLLNQNVTLAKDLLVVSCKELGEANSFITDIAQKSVRERLAEVLILLKNKFGTDENKTLNITLTREELAGIIGTATESVIRLLSDFRQDRLIDLDGRRIKLLNPAELARIGNVY